MTGSGGPKCDVTAAAGGDLLSADRKRDRDIRARTGAWQRSGTGSRAAEWAAGASANQFGRVRRAVVQFRVAAVAGPSSVGRQPKALKWVEVGTCSGQSGLRKQCLEHI